MHEIPNGKIPKQVKIEMTIDIDRDFWVEKIAEGQEPNKLLNKAIEALILMCPRPSIDIFQDHESPTIKDIIIEEEN